MNKIRNNDTTGELDQKIKGFNTSKMNDIFGNSNTVSALFNSDPTAISLIQKQ